MTVRPFILSAIAAAAGLINAVTSITSASQLEAAAASAIPGSVYSIDADITAPVAGTVLTWPAGVTIQESTTRTVTGYFWRFYSAGNYNTTRIGTEPRRLTFVSANTNAPGTYNGTVDCREGKFEFYAKVTGANGGGNKVGNLINFVTTNNNRIEVDFYGGAETSSADCVSADVGVNPVPASSYLRAWSPRCRSPGPNGSDNWFTGHGNIPCFAFNPDFAIPSTNGPGINSAPVNATMEIYGGTIDLTGAGGNGDIFVTRLVGTQITGSTARVVYLVADALKPTKPATCLRVQSTVPIVAKGIHTLAPIFAEAEMTSPNMYVGSLAVGPDYSGPPMLIAKIKGTLSSGSTSLVWLNKGGNVYNTTSIHTTVTNTVAVRANGVGTLMDPLVINIYRADINNTSPVALTYATRNDVAYTNLLLDSSKVQAANAGFTGGVTGATAIPMNTMLIGTEPPGAATGWLNEGPELTSVSRWQNELKPYLATCPVSPGGGGWPSTLDGFLT